MRKDRQHVSYLGANFFSRLFDFYSNYFQLYVGGITYNMSKKLPFAVGVSAESGRFLRIFLEVFLPRFLGVSL